MSEKLICDSAQEWVQDRNNNERVWWMIMELRLELYGNVVHYGKYYANSLCIPVPMLFFHDYSVRIKSEFYNDFKNSFEAQTITVIMSNCGL